MSSALLIQPCDVVRRKLMMWELLSLFRVGVGGWTSKNLAKNTNNYSQVDSHVCVEVRTGIKEQQWKVNWTDTMLTGLKVALTAQGKH